MYSYRIIYGGQDTVEAESPQEAYRVFWEKIKQRCDEGMLGLITETSDPCGSEISDVW